MENFIQKQENKVLPKKARTSGFEEWGGYMAAKKSKLDAQFDHQKLNEIGVSDLTSKIFADVSIYVNGYTKPSADELKRLMMLHGGKYHHYYSLKNTTHMIATNLPQNKITKLKNKKVVTPDWIIDSIKAGKLLPYTNYLLYTPESTFQQNCLNLNLIKEEYPSPALIKNENEHQSFCPVTTMPPESTKPSEAVQAGHPDFISEFYSHSRLHHISTAAQDLKQYVQHLAVAQKGKPFSGREKLHSLRKSAIVASKKEKVIMHLDMDCFFVSVGLRKHPELKGHPVAVAHAKGQQGAPTEGSNLEYEAQQYRKKLKVGDFSDEGDKYQSSQFGSLSEIASCNYEARKSGLWNGMYLGEALRRCPGLKIISYDFEAYSEVTKQLYDIVTSFSLDVEAVSCDELFIDCTEILHSCQVCASDFAYVLRQEIFEKTDCTASAGMGANMLLARLASRVAKPNGQYIVHEHQVIEFMQNQKIKDLPGVGYSTRPKLEQLGILTCHDLQKWPIPKLQKEFGHKKGQTLYEYCRGKDERVVTLEKDRKSVSAEINYGIRFKEEKDIYDFLAELANEVQRRLKHINKKGRSIVLKLMVRRQDAPMETAKFMGHGICDSVSKSTLLKVATDDYKVIHSEVCTLARALKIPPHDYRGIGIQVVKLESSGNDSSKGQTIESFLSKPGPSRDYPEPPLQVKPIESKSSSIHSAVKNPVEKLSSLDSYIPKSIEQIDQSVMMELPASIREELMSAYSKNAQSSSMALRSKTAKLSKQDNPLQSLLAPPQTSKINKKSTISSKSCISTYYAKASTSSESKQVSLKSSVSSSQASLGGAIDIDEVRDLLKEWITTTQSPSDEDVEQFKIYVLKLIEESLEKTDLVLKYFHRMVSAAGELWRETYLSMLSYVQQKMLQDFGYMIKAKSDFV